MLNQFFKNVGPFSIDKLLIRINIENKENFKKDKIYNVSDLSNATDKDLTFFHSKNYSDLASKTKASYCITLENLSQFLPKSCKKIIVKNVLLTMAKVTKEFYPKSIFDDFDDTVREISETSFKKKVKFGKNVLIGKNVKIGKNCLIGHNTIIEKNVIIGSKSWIGLGSCVIENIVIGENVLIGAGSLVLKDLPNNVKAFGSPAKLYKKIN